MTEQIRKAAHEFGSVTVFKAYLELSAVGITKEVINLRSELQSSGVSVRSPSARLIMNRVELIPLFQLTDCPRMDRKKEVVDKMLIVDMLAFALDNPAPAVVMLISGDRDFVYALSVLRHRRYTVVVVIPPSGSHITLKSQANVVLDWMFDIFANSPELRREPSSHKEQQSHITVGETDAPKVSCEEMYPLTHTVQHPTTPDITGPTIT